MLRFYVFICFFISHTIAWPLGTTHENCNRTLSTTLCPHLPKECCCTHKSKELSSGDPTSVEADSEAGPSAITAVCASLTSVPKTFPESTNKIVLKGSSIRALGATTFDITQLGNLDYIQISNDRALESISGGAFSGLANLRTIYIEYVEKLRFISPSAFQNVSKLTKILLKGTGLREVDGFGELTGSLKAHLPLHISLLENHQLEKIQAKAFPVSSPQGVIVNINSNHNLRMIEDNAFYGSDVVQLNLNNNEALTELGNDAFAGAARLEILYLSNTAIHHLPTNGLEHITNLTVAQTPYLIRFPRAEQLPNLLFAEVTYTYHCCALTREAYGFGTTFPIEAGRPEPIPCDADDKTNDSSVDVAHNKWEPEYPAIYDYGHYTLDDHVDDPSNTTVIHIDHYDFDNENPIYDSDDTISSPDESDDDDDSYYTAIHPWQPVVPNITNKDVRKMCYRDGNGKLMPYVHRSPIKCTPHPDLLNPCEDLLGNVGLTVVSWSIACLAVLGNLFVIIVLVAVAIDRSRNQQRHLTVPKFLILNLAFADLCMGVYVLALTAMDAKSSGVYYKFGAEWQELGGCDVSGFLSVFASQLSIFTLSVISLERWYAIRYAIQLDKRMTIRCGKIVMLVGWLVSLLLAILPLVGVNSYRKTAVCLPMEVSTSSGKAYIATLLSVDIVAFVIVIGSYLSMYAIVRSANGREKSFRDIFRRHQKKSSDDIKGGIGCFGAMSSRAADARVAKRMAVLVFTDFACFFPICFFALFAMAGLPLLSLSTAKILLIACLPFNSCCNPFLYAILTKSFRKDARTFYKVHKQSLHTDDRRKARRTDKPSDGGSRQEERRKTLQVYVDGEVYGDMALVSFDHKNVAGAKTTSIPAKPAAKKASYSTCSFTLTRSSESGKVPPVKSKSLPNSNNNNSKRCTTNDAKVIQTRIKPLTSTSSVSEVAGPKPVAVFSIITSLPIALFGKRKRRQLPKSIRFAETPRSSFEMQVSANGAVVLCDTDYAKDVVVTNSNKPADVTKEDKDVAAKPAVVVNASHCEEESFI